MNVGNIARQQEFHDGWGDLGGDWFHGLTRRGPCVFVYLSGVSHLVRRQLGAHAMEQAVVLS